MLNQHSTNMFLYLSFRRRLCESGLSEVGPASASGDGETEESVGEPVRCWEEPKKETIKDLRRERGMRTGASG